jgi:hypothetical protein
MKTIKILILEDDLKTLSVLLDKLSLLEENNQIVDFAVTILSEYTQVEEYINKKNDADFDIILLDRDCKACGSFHVLDFDKFNLDKIISISSVPDYNEEAKKHGVSRIVFKDYQNLEDFSNKVIEEIKILLKI